MNACIEVSAFAIVVWSTYPHVKMFKFLALVRTLVTQATMYFIVVIAVHIFVLVVASLGIVRSFAHFPWCIAMAKDDHYRFAFTQRIHFRECVI